MSVERSNPFAGPAAASALGRVPFFLRFSPAPIFVDLLHSCSGFLRAMLAIEEAGYRTIDAAWSNETGTIARLKLDTQPVSWDGVLYLRHRKNSQTSSA